MREIKFKAWESYFEEMLKVKAIIFDPKTLLPKEEKMEPYILDEHNDIHYLSDIELIQYTNINDYEGKEIYEGDILKCKLSTGKYENYLVVWDKEGACFDALNSDKSNFISPSIWHEFEIIGNIYENPELLGEIMGVNTTKLKEYLKYIQDICSAQGVQNCLTVKCPICEVLGYCIVDEMPSDWKLKEDIQHE